ncbi:hypothetical protein HOY82DRAFT_616203 [Tuber indicum]|nr:hypothetical protein HOY82DRAFT_616203 [Tuber indicum]
MAPGVFRLETEDKGEILRLLSHAMPLLEPGDKTRLPYILHNHDLLNTRHQWSSSLDQAFYLPEFDKVLQYPDTADPDTKSDYRRKIRDEILLTWSGRPGFPTKKEETGELEAGVMSGEERDVQNEPTEKASEAKVAVEVDLTGLETNSPLSVGPSGSTSGPRKASTLASGQTKESVDPSPARPLEPGFSKYKDRIENLQKILKSAWEPIEMSKHQESHLWPDRLENLGEFPPPYARFLNWPNYVDCGYGGQGIYVYDITMQVFIWKAVKSTNRLLDLVSGDRGWREWVVRQSLDHKAIRDRTIEAFRLPCTDTSQRSRPDRFILKIRGHVRGPFLEKSACIIAIPSFVEDFFLDNNKPESTWSETLIFFDTFIDSAKAPTPDAWQSFMCYQLAIDRGRHSLTCADRTRGSIPLQEVPGTNPSPSITARVRQEGSKSGEKVTGLDITAEDSGQVNNPPSYGEPYLFRDPLFMKHKPKSYEMNRRDRNNDKKRIIIVEDCMIEHLIFLMANLDFQEAGHTNKFLSRLRFMDPHKIGFEDQITEFNIHFITAPYWAPSRAGVESPPLPNHFPRRRARFLSMDGSAPDRIMAEAAMGFRIIETILDPRNKVEESRGSCNKYWSQRKCLEGFLVCQALDPVLLETKTILDTTAESMGEGNKSQELFSPLLTVDGFRGENYFKTMNKNSVFYPWLLGVYGALNGKCIKSQKTAEHWISAEKERKYKHRWSRRDQKDFGEKVEETRADVRKRCNELEKMADDIQDRIHRIKTIKESLSSELQLREARTSTQLAHTVNLFAVVTAIYLPLTFSTSIVAIQEFNWPSPAKALVRITLAVTFGTIFFLMNLAFLRRNLAALKRWAQNSIRRRTAGAPELKGSGNNDIHYSESDWWYWYFIAIFIIIVVPVQELTFIIRTLRFQNIENSGPLKKFVRVPWAPIWVLQLALVYVIMLAWYFLSLMGLRASQLVDETGEGYEASYSFRGPPHPKKEKESDEENQETVMGATEAPTSA